MATLDLPAEPRAKAVRFELRSRRRSITILMRDGQAHSVPLSFYPTLTAAPTAARKNYRLIGGGLGIHWPALDLDLSVRGILEGRRETARQGQRRRAG
jgi:hypothetical protein